MSNTGNGGGVEWHQAKIRDYFNRCFDEIYTPFLEVSDDLATALTDFVNDDEHKGAEAEQSKLFVNDCSGDYRFLIYCNADISVAQC